MIFDPTLDLLEQQVKRSQLLCGLFWKTRELGLISHHADRQSLQEEIDWILAELSMLGTEVVSTDRLIHG
jgi:hypothetical protein